MEELAQLLAGTLQCVGIFGPAGPAARNRRDRSVEDA